MTCKTCNGDRFINRHTNLPDDPCPDCNSDAPSAAERLRAAAGGRPHTALRCQSNGYIVLETRQPRSVSTTGARDLIFNIQWFSTKGWINHGEFVDDQTARQVFREQRERNRSIRWRLIARNEHGQVVLPRGWRGFVG